MNTEHGNAEFYAAFAKAQGEMSNVMKDSTNPHFKSDYASLASVLDTVRSVLSKHDIAFFQDTAFDGSMVTVSTLLAHKGGGHISCESSCVPKNHNEQGIGTATTYMRRYGLSAMTGVAQADDDGEGSKHSTPPAPAIRKPKEKPNVPQDAVEKVIEAIQAGRGTADKAIAHWKRKYTISADLERLLRANEPEVAA